MHNLDLFTKAVTASIPNATLSVQDDRVQARAHIKGFGERQVGCSVVNAEKAPQTMAKRVIEAFEKTDWSQQTHTYLVALPPDGSS